MSLQTVEPKSETAPAIRPFRVNVPDSELTELRKRINATRWPEKEPVSGCIARRAARDDAETRALLGDRVRLAQDRGETERPAAVHHRDRWAGHSFHSRSFETRNALPLIVTHGWPGSVIEQMKIIDPLTNPTAHGGTASDAFHLVIPSMPGYGYSGKPTTTGWDVPHIARAWDVLMKRLGYTSYVAQGGDWGAVVVDLMGVQAPTGLLGIHTNMPGIFPADIDGGGLFRRAGAIRSLRRRETRVRACAVRLSKGNRLRVPDGAATADAVRNRGLTCRPGGVFPRSRRAQLRADRTRLRRQAEGLTRDDILDNITIAWLTNTALSWRPSLLGDLWQTRVLQCQRRLHPGCRERLP